MKLAVRAMDHIVRHGPIEKRQELTGPGGEQLVEEVAPGELAHEWPGRLPELEGRVLHLQRGHGAHVEVGSQV